ncbi:hypothetical protein [Anabaena subtropica]|uniref:Uncharacterized protein n=1 Tax=Anabaena subtropica FACHB-260 TaxID=2692884 RepID=A0ABR8CQV4_9NOST|nr:hypothetical protein [Anabaena subtropica]MBD2345587.1 hypothetical protein [Anabaena subtropica FACHB-260]
MRRIIFGFSVILLINACASNIESNSETKNNINPKIENCPQEQIVSLPIVNKNENFYDRFNFHIRNIVADEDIVRFQTLKQDFVFCRSNNTWTVQPGTLPKELKPQENYIEFAQELVNPQFKNIEFQGNTYQYRFVRQPKFILGEDNNISRPDVTDPAKDAVIFELLIPNSTNPKRKTIYTLKDLQEIAVKAGYSATGNQLGFPEITSAIIYNERLWWSIGFEQGEGNNGIATIISYDPKTDQFNLIQPESLWFTQITDLAITGDANNPTFWMGTNVSGEGNLYIPAKGLVAYRPNSQNPNSGSLTTYTTHNSPIVGAIPDKLKLENDKLWVSSANGVCQVKWEVADNPESWSCWRFAPMAKLPQTTPIYRALTDKKSAESLSSGDTVEVLWWNPINYETRKGRYEVRYPQGFTVALDEGHSIYDLPRSLPPGKPSVYWPGFEWSWNGERFVRGFDEIALNLVGGGPQGISSSQLQPDIPTNWNVMRGDLELLNISAKSTNLKYYSGWVDDATLNPYLTVLPQIRPQNSQPNPLSKLGLEGKN